MGQGSLLVVRIGTWRFTNRARQSRARPVGRRFRFRSGSESIFPSNRSFQFRCAPKEGNSLQLFFGGAVDFLPSGRGRGAALGRHGLCFLMVLADAAAFELSRWRDGRCGMGFPRALLAV